MFVKEDAGGRNVKRIVNWLLERKLERCRQREVRTMLCYFDKAMLNEKIRGRCL